MDDPGTTPASILRTGQKCAAPAGCLPPDEHCPYKSFSFPRFSFISFLLLQAGKEFVRMPVGQIFHENRPVTFIAMIVRKLTAFIPHSLAAGSANHLNFQTNNKNFLGSIYQCIPFDIHTNPSEKEKIACFDFNTFCIGKSKETLKTKNSIPIKIRFRYNCLPLVIFDTPSNSLVTLTFSTDLAVPSLGFDD